MEPQMQKFVEAVEKELTAEDDLVMIFYNQSKTIIYFYRNS